MSSVLLEARPFRPFKSSEEYLYAMKEDLAEWLQTMYPHLGINVDNFMEKLETGVVLCEHANAVRHQANEYTEKKQAKKIMTRSVTGSLLQAQALLKVCDVKYFTTAKPGTFFARDNVSNFIKWCRSSLEIIECLLFESDDLIMRKNEKHVILCLLEVARRGAKFGMLAPMLIQMERQIDREIAADQKKLNTNDGMENIHDLDDDSDSDIDDNEPVLMYGPVPQIVTNDLKSLDEMVRDLVAKCTCPTQFPMIRVSEGKYRIGDTKVLIFVRILRNHVMVRVGGGWDTLSHYLDKHDPCRCRSQHRTTQSARLVNKPGASDLHGSQVYYERSPIYSSALSQTTTNNLNNGITSLGPPMNSLNRSRSRSPSNLLSHDHHTTRRSVSPNLNRKSLIPPPQQNRSRSPTPNYTSTHHLTKLSAGKKPATPTLSPRHHQNKCPQQQQHITSIQIPVETNKVLKSETTLQISETLTDHSDTTSEMSDEGYRSLGIVVQDKNKQRSSLYSQNSMEDAEDNEHSIDDLNDFGLRKTKFSQRIYENNLIDKKLNEPKTTTQFLNSTTTLSANMAAPSVGMSAPSSATTTPIKQLIRANSVERSEKLQLPPMSSSSIIKKSTQQQLNNNNNSNSKINTWNGRQKSSRPSLTCDTFVRNSNTRRSISSGGNIYDKRRSLSTNTSPTKGKLRQELLNTVKNIDDDELIVQQVHELLKKYGSMNVLNDDDDHNDYDYNKSRFLRNTDERLSVRTIRKDSRPDNNLSRIPAPIVHS